MLKAGLNFFQNVLSLTLWHNLYLEINTDISISKLYLIYYYLHYFGYFYYLVATFVYINILVTDISAFRYLRKEYYI